MRIVRTILQKIRRLITGRGTDMILNMGTTFEGMRAKIFCTKCGCKGRERHHITYNPEEIALLCHKCHTDITHLNKMASRRVPKGHPYRPLSNKQRRRIWKRYLNG